MDKFLSPAGSSQAWADDGSPHIVKADNAVAPRGHTGAREGRRNITQSTANIAATDLELTSDDLGQLNAVSAPTPSYPQWIQDMLAHMRVPA